MSEISIPIPDRPAGYRRPPDDAPSIHSSLDLIVPDTPVQPNLPSMQELFYKGWQAQDSTFRDAQEYQGRSQDIMETGLPALPPNEGYRNSQPARA